MILLKLRIRNGIPLYPTPALFPNAFSRAVAFARIECHFWVNGGWLRDGQLIEEAHKIAHLPIVIVQGRYDVVCPMESAWALHRAWPEADLIVTPDSGHSAFDPPNSRALVAATDRLACL